MRRYQLLEAGGNHRNANLNDDDDDFNFEDHPPLQICTSSRSKNIIIFGILITLGLFIYIPFLPFSSNRPIAFVWPANQSRDVSLLVRPQEVTTKIWPTSACPQNESKSEDLFLLVIVFSAIKNFNERQTIRDSWASDEIPNSQVIFLLGHVGNDSIPLQINVTKESETFGDILQEDFIDSYANLSLKTLMMLKWYEQSCSHVPYVLKTDDDVYINMNNLYKLVKMNKIPNLLMGTLICGAVPIRDPYNKWYSPHYMYDKKRYPNYLSGTGYVTGILAQKSGIRPQDNVGFSYLKRRATICLYAQTISSHHLTIREMHQMHEKVKAKQGKCAPIKKKYLRTYGPGRCLWTKPK